MIAEVRPPGKAQLFGFPVGPRSKNISFYESNCNQRLYCTKSEATYFGMKNILNLCHVNCHTRHIRYFGTWLPTFRKKLLPLTSE